MPRKTRGISAPAERARQTQVPNAPEDDERRADSLSPTRVLFVTERTICQTWRAFEVGARLGVESSVRWAGAAYQLDCSMQVVTSIIIPHQRVSRGFFEIPHESTRAMGEALGDLGLVNLAQLHTHPSASVNHSPWDDAHAYSSRNGALSIVWPHYGRRLPSLDSWGVHERQQGRWVRLKGTEASRRIVVVPESVDLRIAFELIGDLEGAIDEAD